MVQLALMMVWWYSVAYDENKLKSVPVKYRNTISVLGMTVAYSASPINHYNINNLLSKHSNYFFKH